jgi:hypothetical protein
MSADSGVRHALLDGRHSGFCQDYQIFCTLFSMLRDLPIGHAVIPISRGILCRKFINHHCTGPGPSKIRNRPRP